MGLSGDDRKLEIFIRRLGELGSPAKRRELSRVLSRTSLGLVDEGFRTGRGPTGRAWPQPQHRAGPPMRDTEELRESFHVEHVGPDGFTIASPLDRAGALQKGARLERRRSRVRRRRARRRRALSRLAARRMVPEGRAGRWAPRLRSSAAAWMRAHMGQ
jgi:hypothetical protein